jgi:phenylpyruvate tautomerase PptA (4-oxalocrotonate tautomerase family)
MPIIQVEALPQSQDVDVERVLGTACTAVALLIGEEPSGTWGTWRTLEHYVEGREGPSVQPLSTHPPLVRVIVFQGRPPEQITEIVNCVATVLVRELGLEEGNVFVMFEETSRGELHPDSEAAS